MCISMKDASQADLGALARQFAGEDATVVPASDPPTQPIPVPATGLAPTDG